MPITGRKGGRQRYASKNTASDRASCVARRTSSLFHDALNLRIAPATCQDGSWETLGHDGGMVSWKDQVAIRFGIKGWCVLKFGAEGRYHSPSIIIRKTNDERPGSKHPGGTSIGRRVRYGERNQRSGGRRFCDVSQAGAKSRAATEQQHPPAALGGEDGQVDAAGGDPLGRRLRGGV
jgi:hypothetical protein